MSPSTSQDKSWLSRRLVIAITILSTLVAIAPIALWFDSIDRAVLPVDRITAVNNATYVSRRQIRLISLGFVPGPDGEDCLTSLAKSMNKNLQEKEYVSVHATGDLIHAPMLKNSIKSRDHASTDELLRELIVRGAGAGQHKLDNAYARGTEPGVIHFVVIPTLTESQTEPIVVMGKYRHGWILLPVDPESQPENKPTKAMCGNDQSSAIVQAVDRLMNAGQPPVGDLDSFLSLKYKITFSMLVSAAVGGPVDWEIETALARFVDPFIKKLGVIADFVIDSQVLYASRLSDSEAKASLDTAKDFEGFLSVNDWKVTAANTVREKEIHAMTYFGSPAEALVSSSSSEYESESVDSSSSGLRVDGSFLVPRWGAVVANTLTNESFVTNGGVLKHSVLDPVFAHLTAHLRMLLGFPTCAHAGTGPQRDQKYQLFCVQHAHHGVSDWELDAAVAFLFNRHSTSAAKSLSALARLSIEMPHMPISKSVQTKVLDALAILEGLKGEVLATDVRKKLLKARSALDLAEDAFYDSSLIPQLYFADEHLYAIYLPLLIPVIMPIVLGCGIEIKRIMKRRREAAAKAATPDEKKLQ